MIEMRYSRAIAQIFVVLFLPSSGVAQQYHTRPDKWSEPRIFHQRFESQYGDRIVISRVPVQEFPNKEFSSNKAYWFAIRTPNYMRPRPWSTQLFIYQERPYLVKIDVKDHAHYDNRVTWVSEKLIYVRVWWGRVLGSDFVIDVEAEKIVHREMVHDGGIPFQQFRQQLRK